MDSKQGDKGESGDESIPELNMSQPFIAGDLDETITTEGKECKRSDTTFRNPLLYSLI